MPSPYAEQIARIDERTAGIRRDLTAMDKKLDKINGTLDDHESRLSKVEERQGILAGINSVVSVVVAGIAAAIGIQR